MIEVIYLGTNDCFYCQHWEAARRPELLAMFSGRDARLVEIRGETLALPITLRHYPSEHRWVHRDIGDVRGVPRFVLAVDGKVVMRVSGTSNYTEILAPRIRAELERRRR